MNAPATPSATRSADALLRAAVAASRAAILPQFTVQSVTKHLDDVPARWSLKTFAGRVVTLRAFGQWLVRSETWSENPFASLQGPGKTKDADRKFRRRRLTLAEVGRLAEAAMVRPVAEYAKSHGGRPNPRAAAIEMVSRERALIYWICATTGLRNDFTFFFVILCIQNHMGDSFARKVC